MAGFLRHQKQLDAGQQPGEQGRGIFSSAEQPDGSGSVPKHNLADAGGLGKLRNLERKVRAVGNGLLRAGLCGEVQVGLQLARGLGGNAGVRGWFDIERRKLGVKRARKNSARLNDARVVGRGRNADEHVLLARCGLTIQVRCLRTNQQWASLHSISRLRGVVDGILSIRTRRGASFPNKQQ